MARWIFFLSLALAIGLVSGSPCATLYSMWDLEAVDEDGLGTHPLVGAEPVPENRVAVVGIALNTTGEIIDPVEDWQYTIFLQDLTGGLQVWAGRWWYPEQQFPPQYMAVEAGDLVRVEGFIMNHNGKVFINDRHSPSPDVWFTVAILEKGVGMPEPKLIPSISACNYFDQSRAGGGEKYQTRWSRLNDVEIVSGTWGSYVEDVKGEMTITDGTGELTMRLARQGDFDDYAAPTGKFDVIGIFDQEDPEEFEGDPFHENYRIWVKRYKHIIPVVEAPTMEIRKAIKVQWMSVDGVTYHVYRSDDLETWQPVGDPLIGDGTALSIFDDVEGVWKKFYKIEIE